jgi:hypothetical protein
MDAFSLDAGWLAPDPTGVNHRPEA